MRSIAWALVSCALLESVAQAAQGQGCLGVDDDLALVALGGPLSATGRGDDHNGNMNASFDLSGQMFGFRMAMCQLRTRSHFGALMGFDASMTFGWYLQSAVAPNATVNSKAGTTQFLFDLQIGPHAVVHQWSDRARFAILGGFGLESDFAYVYGGAELGVKASRSFLIDLGYQVVPFGAGSQGASVFEHRPRLELVFGMGKTLGLGLGAEARIGKNVDSGGVAPYNSAIKGSYREIAVSLQLRFRF
jgi:hypothetical protein